MKNESLQLILPKTSEAKLRQCDYGLVWPIIERQRRLIRCPWCGAFLDYDSSKITRIVEVQEIFVMGFKQPIYTYPSSKRYEAVTTWKCRCCNQIKKEEWRINFSL